MAKGTEPWPVGLWGRARKRGFEDWDSYMRAIPLQDVLYDIEGTLDDLVTDSSSDFIKGVYRRSSEYSALLALRYHGFDGPRPAPSHLESVELAPEILAALIGWATAKGMDGVVVALKRMADRRKDPTREELEMPGQPLTVIGTQLVEPDDSDREILIYCAFRYQGGYQIVALEASLPKAKASENGVEDTVYPTLEAAQSALADLTS